MMTAKYGQFLTPSNENHLTYKSLLSKGNDGFEKRDILFAIHRLENIFFKDILNQAYTLIFKPKEFPVMTNGYEVANLIDLLGTMEIEERNQLLEQRNFSLMNESRRQALAFNMNLSSDFIKKFGLLTNVIVDDDELL